jgi:hypothetical protein
MSIAIDGAILRRDDMPRPTTPTPWTKPLAHKLNWTDADRDVQRQIEPLASMRENRVSVAVDGELAICLSYHWGHHEVFVPLREGPHQVAQMDGSFLTYNTEEGCCAGIFLSQLFSINYTSTTSFPPHVPYQRKKCTSPSLVIATK